MHHDVPPPVLQVDGKTAPALLGMILSTLERCVRLNLVASRSRQGSAANTSRTLGAGLRTTLRTGLTMASAGKVGIGQWRSFCALASTQLGRLPEFRDVVRSAEEAAGMSLPEPLLSFAGRPARTNEEAELACVLPRYGRILRHLDLIGQMLEADEPLKPSLVIFAASSRRYSS